MMCSMPGSGKSRNSPCFCGAGRKLKQCCLRSLRQVRQWKLPGSSCRWRFWEARGHGAETFAGEVAEHRCSGEHVWIARETSDGMTWMVDHDPASLLEVIDRLPGGLYDWVVEQTLAALRSPLRASDARAAPELGIGRDDDELLMDGRQLAAVQDLLVELLRLVHVSDVLAARLGLDAADSEPGDPTALARVRAAAA